MTDEMTQKRVVVGYFREGADAHRALNALLDEGFSASQVGAAFRSEPLSGNLTGNRPGTGSETRTGEAREEQIATADASGELEPRRTTDKLYTGTTNSSISGPTSGTGGVTPAGLSPGSGDLFSGPTPHGGIPGADTPSNLPSELKHELPSQFDRPAERGSAPVSAGHAPWIEEARRTFRDRHSREGQNQQRKNDESMNFGSGEGHLALNEGEWDYSPQDFEHSFSGMGMEPAPARYFSGALRQGGAILTVEAGPRAEEAEAILERHNGRVRIETESQAGTGTDRWEAAHEGARVHVFGQIGHHYRSASGTRLEERKAS